MAQAVVLNGQTLLDYAVEHRGAWEAAIDIALMAGVSLTDTPVVGKAYPLPDKVYDRVMQQHCAVRSISPATLGERTAGQWRIFSEEFNHVFN